MSNYILREVGKTLARHTRHEVLTRLLGQAPRQLRRKVADVVREERNVR